MTPKIRPEAPGDIAAIHAVHAAAFPTDGEARLVDALRSGGQAAVSLVAILGSHVVGHVLFSPVTLEGTSGGVGLAPLAVLPAHQRKGIGGALIEAGIEACRNTGLQYAVVLGDPHYYGRFGFLRAMDAGLGNEYGVDEEFMVLELQHGALHGVRGVVKYRSEFSVLG